MSRLDFCQYELVDDCYDWKNDNCDECNIFKAYCEGARRAKNSIVRCKDCIHYEKHDTWSACTYWSGNPYEQASVIDDDFCSYGERAEQTDEVHKPDYSYEAEMCKRLSEQTEYKMPGHDEVMEALDKLTIRKVTDKDETEYLNRTFEHDDGEWHDLTDTLKGKPRLVDANDLMDNLPCLKIKKLDCDFCSFYKNKTSECLLEKWIGNAPTVQAVPRSLYENLLLRKDRPHGEWLHNAFYSGNEYKCSVCGETFKFLMGANYCPNCGAQMICEGSDSE